MTKFFIGFLILANVTCCLMGMEEVELQEVPTVKQKWRPIIELATEKSNQYHPAIEKFFADQLMLQDNKVRAHEFMQLQTTIHKQVGNAFTNDSAKQTLLDHLLIVYYKKQKIFYQEMLQYSEEKLKKAYTALGKNKN